MVSIIPNRKPDTPLHRLFATGKYNSKIENNQFKKQSAFPGPGLLITEKNKRLNDEVNIKPIIHQRIGSEFYNPKHYLSPFKVDDTKRDVALNSLHSTRIFNRKLSVMQQKPTKEISKQNFNELKKHSSQAVFTPSQRLRPLVEAHNYISQNENQFYKSSKIFFKPATSYNKYQFSTPDYFRVDEKKLDMNKAGSNAFKPGETVTVISRTNGWLTVDPKNMSRKNAFEKKMKGNLHKTSHMSPSWMHNQAQRDENQFKSFKPLTVKRQNLRCESNRLYLADKNQASRSIFNIGQIRHNVHTKEEAEKIMVTQRNNLMKPSRLLEWNENPQKQKYDCIRVTGKIGQQ